MTQWPQKPFIYEINTAVWLTELSRQFNKPITLKNVPDAVLDQLATLNVDTIWLMGVWQRSPAVRASALNYQHEYRPVLNDLTEADVIGSAYAIGAYVVDERLGGPDALASIRKRLRKRGLKLVLDYVPNHVAVDHPWVTQNPEYMIQGTPEELMAYPDRFFPIEQPDGEILITGHGRDPYFPGWIDTAQVNVFSLQYREVVRDILLDIASQCDGIRCDMAMLVTNDIFQQTWGQHMQHPVPATEFWDDMIPAVKAKYPDCKFIAEVYWDMEYTMLQQGFDFTYDKTLYDRLIEGNPQKIREHLWADVAYQMRQMRFIENHDEPRAASSLGVERSRPAAVLVATLPGGVLLHDGQFSGRRIKLPVQINRQPEETPHLSLQALYRELLAETQHPIYQHGEWRTFGLKWPLGGTDTTQNLIAYGWQLNDEFRLIVVNMTYVWSQAVVDLSAWGDLAQSRWGLRDVLRGTYRFVEGKQLVDVGLEVALEGYEAMVLRFDWLDMNRARNFIRIAAGWQR